MNDIATPTPDFETLEIPETLRDAIRSRGLLAPTAVQLRVADPANASRDLLVSSQTGSGKTLAFGFLIARELLDPDGRVPRETTVRGATPAPLSLVVAPTRELAVQVRRELAWLMEPAGARVLSVTGGSDAREELKKLRSGCEVMVATPGRLTDHLRRKNVSLSKARVVVLDEADEMLSLGFREDLETILKESPKPRRTHLFSATLPKPILQLAAKYQEDAFRVSASMDGAKAHQDIDYFAHLFAPGDREAAVVNVLRRYAPATGAPAATRTAGAAIVFCATRAGVAKLGTDLGKRGFSVTSISGDLTQSERTRALSSLREGRANVLVATDVAARGLDLPDVGLVVHADLPQEATGLTHRSGRTGRAGRKGVSVLLASRNERAKAERMAKHAGFPPRWTPLPDPAEIVAADRDRLVSELAAEARTPLDADTGEFVDRILGAVPVRELVAALVGRSRSSLPAPAPIRPIHPDASRARTPAAASRTEMSRREGPGVPTGRSPAREAIARRPDRAPRREPAPPREAPSLREERPRREGAPRREAAPGSEAARRESGGARAGARAGPAARPAGKRGPMVRFRVNVGERQNADPRWLMPLICRRGQIDGSGVGAIDVQRRTTTFEVSADAAERFEAAVSKADPQEPKVRFERVDESREPPREAPPSRARPAGPRAPERKAPSGARKKVSSRPAGPGREKPARAGRPVARAPAGYEERD